MKRTIVLFALVLLLAGCDRGFDTAAPEDRSSNRQQADKTETTATSDLRTVTIDASDGEEVKVRVEIADSPDEQAKGLMNRKKLGEDRGMLFVFPDQQVRSFWMKDTLIPLSIAYIDSDGRIIDLQDMKALDDQPPHYVSAKPAKYALEANKGFFEERGVEVGDRADLPE